MAEIKSVIVLSNGTELRVQEDSEAIQNRIDGVTSKHIARIDLTDANGVVHAVNAHQIVEWHSP